MSHTPIIGTPFLDRVRGETRRMTWLGIALLLLGIAALIWPEVSTLAATFYVGVVLVVAGLAGVFGAFSLRGTGPFFGALLLGLLSLASGVFLLFRPGIGMIALTLAVGGLFIVQGAAETFLALESRPAAGWGWMLVSAIASVLLAFLILAGWPGTSLFALGVLIGVNFITSGVAYIGLANSIRGGLASRRSDGSV